MMPINDATLQRKLTVFSFQNRMIVEDNDDNKEVAMGIIYIEILIKALVKGYIYIYMLGVLPILYEK
jgi:hypothetical protein